MLSLTNYNKARSYKAELHFCIRYWRTQEAHAVQGFELASIFNLQVLQQLASPFLHFYFKGSSSSLVSFTTFMLISSNFCQFRMSLKLNQFQGRAQEFERGRAAV